MTDFLPKISSAKDWPEAWKDLQTIDSLLRCSVCGEFFKDTTFIPSCSHNYCSLCIRRYICINSKCPICDVNVQDTQLENNRIIDEIVKCFVQMRDKLLDVVKNSSNNIPEQQVKKNNELGKGVKTKVGDKSRFFTTKDKATTSQTAKPSQKRHRKDSSASEKSSSNDRWSPVERKKKMKRSSVRDDSSDSDEISIIENSTPKRSPGLTSLARLGKDGKCQDNEDLVDCPVCGQKIPNARINIHLDTCLSGKERKENLRSSSSQSPAKKDPEAFEASSHIGANSFIPQVVRRKPLNKLVYALLSNTDLKRKMKEHGLSNKGDRQTLIKRHQEFTVMYNSECSKPKPKTVSEIVRLVEEGERKKNRPVENRDKLNFERTQNQEDIDKKKSEYLSQNHSEFTRLINEIRSRKKKGNGGNNIDDNREASTSKMEPGPSTSEEKFVKRILPSDDETASNSSGTDFEPVQKRFSTPRRQLRSSTVTEKRITRSSAKIPEKIVEEVDESCSCGTTEDEGEEKECDDPVDRMESCTATTTLPDPPSPLLLDGLCEKEAKVSDHSGESSGSECILHISGFGAPSPIKNKLPESPPQDDDGDQSEEIEF